MSWRVLTAALVGYSVGNAPDHSTFWLGVKVVFTVGLLALMLAAARDERNWPIRAPFRLFLER